MSNIGALIGMAGLFGMPVCLILAIRSLIKKQPSKKFWLAVPVCFLMFFVGGLLSSNKEPQPSQPAQIAAATTEPTTAATTAPTTEATTEPTTESTTEATTEPETKPRTVEENLDIIKSILLMTFPDDDIQRTVETNPEDHSVIISMKMEGLAMSAVQAMINAEVKKAWDESVASLQTACNDYVESARTIYPECNINLIVLSDLDETKTLLEIYNGEILRDCVNSN